MWRAKGVDRGVDNNKNEPKMRNRNERGKWERRRPNGGKCRLGRRRVAGHGERPGTDDHYGSGARTEPPNSDTHLLRAPTPSNGSTTRPNGRVALVASARNGQNSGRWQAGGRLAGSRPYSEMSRRLVSTGRAAGSCRPFRTWPVAGFVGKIRRDSRLAARIAGSS